MDVGQEIQRMCRSLILARSFLFDHGIPEAVVATVYNGDPGRSPFTDSIEVYCIACGRSGLVERSSIPESSIDDAGRATGLCPACTVETRSTP